MTFCGYSRETKKSRGMDEKVVLEIAVQCGGKKSIA